MIMDSGMPGWGAETVVPDIGSYPLPTTAMPVPPYQGPIPQPSVPQLNPAPLSPIPEGTAPRERYDIPSRRARCPRQT